MFADRMPTGRGIAQLATVPDSECRDGGPESLRPFMCVGAAYFLIAVLIPSLLLVRGGECGGWTTKGVVWSLLAGVAGAVTVLVFKPQAAPHAAPAPAAVAADAEQPAAEPAKTPQRKAKRFVEILLATCMTLFCWGDYGSVLHRGQAAMGGSRLLPLLCIGIAYFLIAVLVPLALLRPMGDAGNWGVGGTMWSLAAGGLGALGALGTILAFNCGGKPFTVMPVVFGCAPVINALTTLALAHTPTSAISPFLLAGMLVVAVGAATVLVFGPRGPAPAKPA